MKTIVWAIDPFSDLKTVVKKTDEILCLIKKDIDFKIQPVFILSSRNIPWINYMMAPPLKKFLPMAEDACEKWLKKSNLDTLPTKIILNENLSKFSEIKKLLNFCKKEKAVFITVNTHARKGVKRLIMGSFAESLLMHSKIPLLFISPRIQSVKKIKKILFPTDFSSNSLKALRSFTKSIPAKEKNLSFLNVMTHTLGALSQSTIDLPEGSFVSYSEYLDLEKQARKKKAKRLIDAAKKLGFKASADIIAEPGTLSENIIEKAHADNCDFIALASESGTLTTMVLGSTARNLVRISDKPIWIFHT